MKSHCDDRKNPQFPNNILTSIEMPNLERGRNKGFLGIDLPHLVGSVTGEEDQHSGWDLAGI